MLLKGGGVSCFLARQEEKIFLGGNGGVCRIADVVGAVETRGRILLRGKGCWGGEIFQPVMMWRKSWRQSLLQIFVFRHHQPVTDCTLEPFALFLVRQVKKAHSPISGEIVVRSPELLLTLVDCSPVCLMCFSFKEISLRSVSLPLFVCEEGVAF